MKHSYLFMAKISSDVNNSVYFYMVWKSLLQAILCMLDENLASAKMM